MVGGQEKGGLVEAASCQADLARITGASDQFIALATLFRTPLTLLPTVRIAAMAATAINEAIRVYSMAVAPRSLFIRRRKMDSMGLSPNEENVFDLGPAPATIAHAVLGTKGAIDATLGGRQSAPDLKKWMRPVK